VILNKVKKITVFTSIRSEYGLLKPLLDKIKSDDAFDLFLLVGGAHLKNEFGFTKKQILADGFDIFAELDFLQNQNTSNYVSKSMGVLQMQIGEWLVTNKPDLLIVLGDRFELLPVVTSFLMSNIPIAHISGGDVTEGAIDNQIRNAITKMAHIHFPATEICRRNIIKMGEESWRICVSGEPGLDEILKIHYIPKSDLFNELGLNEKLPVICTTFHPETIQNKITASFIEVLLLKIINTTNYQILVTSSNFDNGGLEINNVLKKLSSQYHSIKYFESLGQRKYYSLLKYSDIMLGNSSSGLVEAQSFNLPVINVGVRQAGRLANASTFNTIVNIDAVMNALAYVKTEKFVTAFKDKVNIYGDGNACERILQFIKEINTRDLLIKKSTF